MAFTSAQLAQIRWYLGYPDVYIYANPRLESAMVQVGNDADASAIVLGLLTLISADLAAMSGFALTMAGVQSLDKGDAAMFQGQSIKDIGRIGRMHCGQLSQRFGAPKGNDIFSEQGYSGDWWRAENGRPTLAGLG